MADRSIVRCARIFGAVMALCAAGDAGPARGAFATFETGQVRPLALSPDGSRLFALNTPDNRLEIFAVGGGTLVHAGSVPVGMEPIAVAARNNSEVWVVNHLSDSVSIVDVAASPPRVVRTLLVGDEPRDIVFAGPTFNRAFIATARRGQHLPASLPALLTTPGTPRALVWVFDANDLGTSLEGEPETIVELFGDTPRALAATPDGTTVYAAVFHSGNQTTALSEGAVCDGGSGAAPCFLDGVHVPGGLAGDQVPGGLPAPGGSPETGLIVKFDDASGEWHDELGRNWTNAVRFSLPDLDVFAIDAAAATPAETAAFAHVGTVLFNMAVHPTNGTVYVSNTEARNEVRFEGPGTSASTVRGHLHEARITVIDGVDVLPRHLNKHIPALAQGYRTVPMPPGVAEDSLATPLDMAITSDGTLYVAAFGSSAVGVFTTAELDGDTFWPNSTFQIAVTGGGPSGLALDEDNDRLYVLTRFDNAVKVIDTVAAVEVAQHPLHNPEPAAVVGGRPFLYDATFTSSNGEASCASCHVFGDFDSLAWDLGNPDEGNVTVGGNTFQPLKGPMTTQTLRGLAHHGPMHWRGERAGPAFPNDPPGLTERLAFESFNVAFEGLLGRDDGELDAADMTAFAEFAIEILSPPNPVRALDNQLTAEQASGRSTYLTTPSTAGANCNACHRLDPGAGLFGTSGQTVFDGEPQLFKIAHLRNAYQKVGMFGMPDVAFFHVPAATRQPQGDQVRGFGYFHDGSVDTLFTFMHAFPFNLTPTQRVDLEQFALAFDTTFAPIVGQQITLTDTNGATVGARIDLMLQRAATPYDLVGQPGATECDLVVAGVVGGEDRGYLFDTTANAFRGDRAAEPTLTDAQLRALVSGVGAKLTYTCAPPGSGARMALDRDGDTFFNRDEIDAGSDPADPDSIPGGGPTPTHTPTATPTPTPGLCDAVPPSCRSAGKSSLRIKAKPGRESLVWKWQKGAQTDFSAFGDPAFGSTEYALCIYAGASLIAELRVPAQGVCDGRPCWAPKSTGFKYRDRSLSNDAVQQVQLKAGASGKAKAAFKAGGAGMPLLPLPPAGLDLPVTVRLVNTESECWQSAYETARDNTAELFRANQ